MTSEHDRADTKYVVMHEEGAQSVRTVIQGLVLAAVTGLAIVMWQMHTDVVLLTAQMSFMSQEISALKIQVAQR